MRFKDLSWVLLFVFVIGICLNIGQPIGEFLSGFGVELSGFAITLLFFEFFQQRRLFREERQANTDILRIVYPYIVNLERGLVKWRLNKENIGYHEAITEDDKNHILQYASEETVALPSNKNFIFHLVTVPYLEAISYVKTMLPLVKTYTKEGEVFKEKLLTILDSEAQIQDFQNKLENYVSYAPDIKDDKDIRAAIHEVVVAVKHNGVGFVSVFKELRSDFNLS